MFPGWSGIVTRGMDGIVAILAGIPCAFSPTFALAYDIINIETMTCRAEQRTNTATETSL